MKIDLVIFDWSGVISDDRRPVYAANVQVLRDYKKPRMSFEEWLPRTTMTPVEFFANHGVHGDSKKLYALYKKYYSEAVESGMVPKVYPDARDVFQYLRKGGKQIAVLGSHPIDNLKREAKDYALASFLSSIHGSARDKIEGLHTVCRELETVPEGASYVGDTIYDIRAAKKAGLHSVGVCTGYHTKERLEKEEPEFLLECLSDLKEIL